MVKNENALLSQIYHFKPNLPPNSPQKCKKNCTPKIPENSSPHRDDLTSVSKKSKFFLQITMGKITKAPRKFS